MAQQRFIPKISHNEGTEFDCPFVAILKIVIYNRKISLSLQSFAGMASDISSATDHKNRHQKAPLAKKI
jgi:hypothetical protein